MKITAKRRDDTAINQGEWIGGVPLMGDIELCVRGRTNKLFDVAFDRHIRALPREDRDRVGVPTAEARVRCVGLACVETVLLDWRNVQDENGKEIPFDKDLAKLWLTDPAYEHFLDAVLYAATVVDNKEPEGKETAGKKSSKSSSGS